MRARLVWAAVSLPVLVLPLHQVLAQATPSEVETRVRGVLELVVMLEGRVDGAPVIGAGVIVGRRAGVVYIATANHIVRKGLSEASELTAAFRSAPGKRVSATLLSNVERNIDLAVLSVDEAALGASLLDSLRLDLLGTKAPMRGDSVYLIGQPQGRFWQVPVTPDVVAEVSFGRIRFQSTIISPGHSGGALYNAEGMIVGMTVEDDPPFGVAVRIDDILTTLKRWNYPVQLSQPDSLTLAGNSAPASVAKERARFVEYLRTASRWGDDPSRVRNEVGWVDAAIKDNKDADLFIGVDQSRDGKAHHLRWRDNQFSYRRFTPQEATFQDFDARGTLLETRRSGLPLYMNRISIGDDDRIVEGQPIRIRVWLRRGGNFDEWVRKYKRPGPTDTLYLAFRYALVGDRDNWFFAPIRRAISNEDSRFEFQMDWPDALSGRSELANAYLLIGLAPSVNERGGVSIEAMSDGYIVSARILPKR